MIMRWRRVLFPRRYLTMKISVDPFNELGSVEKVPGLKQRFPDRVLIMTSDKCFGYCEHCTRKHILGRSSVVDTPEKLRASLSYVKARPLIRDVLLSGGDFLTLDDKKVAMFIDAFASLKQIEIIRVCTRALVTNPKRITPRLVKILSRSKKVWVNCHINTAEEVAIASKAAARLVDGGLPVSSQTVLLRGVNDDKDKMLALLKALSAARIRPYYVFQCDPVKGVYERFAVPLRRAKAIEKYCAEHIGGLSLPRFVADLPGAKRKTPLSALSSS